MSTLKKNKDQKVNFEFNKEFIKVVTDKIANNDALFIINSFKEMHPADAADIIEHLNQNDRENLIKLNNFKISRGDAQPNHSQLRIKLLRFDKFKGRTASSGQASHRLIVHQLIEG